MKKYSGPFCGNELKIYWQETTDSAGNKEYDAECETAGCFLEYGAGWYATLEEMERKLERVQDKS